MTNHENQVDRIHKLTNLWIYEVTINKDPWSVYNLFCKNATLLGTVSQTLRTGHRIKEYFDYFAKLPKLEVLNKKYNITKVNDLVYINTAFVTWTWEGLPKPIVARMTFTYNDNCIIQLHSSMLPKVNKALRYQ